MPEDATPSPRLANSIRDLHCTSEADVKALMQAVLRILSDFNAGQEDSADTARVFMTQYTALFNALAYLIAHHTTGHGRQSAIDACRHEINLAVRAHAGDAGPAH
jgi:hypothetical protein